MQTVTDQQSTHMVVTAAIPQSNQFLFSANTFSCICLSAILTLTKAAMGGGHVQAKPYCIAYTSSLKSHTYTSTHVRFSKPLSETPMEHNRFLEGLNCV